VRVPPALRPVATSIAGLSHVAPPVRGTSTRRPAARAARESQVDAAPVLRGCSGGSAMDMRALGYGEPVTPLGVAQAYGFDRIGSGPAYPQQSIAVLEIGENYLPADVARYQADCRFSHGTIEVDQVNVPGAPTLEGTTDNTEANLDAQWLSALAPAGTRVVVINVSPTSATWLVDFLEQAVVLPGLSAVSISYAASEVQAPGDATSPPAEYVQYQHGMAVLAASGPTAIVASGDMGSMGPSATTCPALFPSYGLPGQASVNWLAASPGVTAVGGTMWPGYLRPADEPVWNQAAGVGPVPWACGSAGGGGGQSVVSARPAWQAAAGAGIPGSMRLVPDLAMLSGLPGFATITNGRSSVTAGTSAAAPVLAAAVLRINAERLAAGRARVGFLNPLLYGLLAPTFTDVVTGGNDIFGNGICCTAGPGFDMASGLGAPNIGQWPALIP
jgi:subtilase family serine protease